MRSNGFGIWFNFLSRQRPNIKKVYSDLPMLLLQCETLKTGFLDGRYLGVK